MRKFSDLNIKSDKKIFNCKQVSINDILNVEIAVVDAIMQIELREKRYMMWGNYKYLIEQISQIDSANLPFKATIVNEHGYIFK